MKNALPDFVANPRLPASYNEEAERQEHARELARLRRQAARRAAEAEENK